MELVQLIITLVIGLLGFCAMAAAFVLIARRGGWQRAMQPTAEDRWPLPRRLMLVGAMLGVLFGVLYWVLVLLGNQDRPEPQRKIRLGTFGWGTLGDAVATREDGYLSSSYCRLQPASVSTRLQPGGNRLRAGEEPASRSSLASRLKPAGERSGVTITPTEVGASQVSAEADKDRRWQRRPRRAGVACRRGVEKVSGSGKGVRNLLSPWDGKTTTKRNASLLPVSSASAPAA